MAYVASGLQVEFGRGNYGGASVDGKKFFKLASYITDDTAAVVEAVGYFNSAADRLVVGSIIMAVMGMGGTMKLKNYLVTANDGTVVTIALQTTAAG